MKFFLDTANIDLIKKYASWGVVDGVTTNPSLLAKEGVSLEKRIKEIAKEIDGPISAEAVSTTAEEMIEEGRKYSKWAKNVCVKIAMNEEGIKAVKVLSKEGIKTNVTLVFSAGQALLAAKNGATFVSPFVGRLDDVSEDGMALISEIVTIFRNYNLKTEVIIASVRHPRHVIDGAMIGAEIATIPPEVLEKLIKHPLTDKGIEAFLKDWEKVKNLK
jgi:transaldolase